MKKNSKQINNNKKVSNLIKKKKQDNFIFSKLARFLRKEEKRGTRRRIECRSLTVAPPPTRAGQ